MNLARKWVDNRVTIQVFLFSFLSLKIGEIGRLKIEGVGFILSLFLQKINYKISL